MEHSLSYMTDEQRRMTEIEALKGVTNFVYAALLKRKTGLTSVAEPMRG